MDMIMHDWMSKREVMDKYSSRAGISIVYTTMS